MPQRFLEPTLALLFALAVIGGARGGGAAAAWQVLRGKRIGWAFVAAYLLVGDAFGIDRRIGAAAAERLKPVQIRHSAHHLVCQ